MSLRRGSSTTDVLALTHCDEEEAGTHPGLLVFLSAGE